MLVRVHDEACVVQTISIRDKRVLRWPLLGIDCNIIRLRRKS